MRFGNVARVCAALSVALVCAVAGGTHHTASACGIGGNTPTMLANTTPALAFPVIGNVSADQPIGVFALSYLTKQEIAFDEDVSRVPGAPPKESLKWRWSFGDGTAFTYAQEPKHVFAKAGTFNVHAQIFDPSVSNWVDLDSAQIRVLASVPANPPHAEFDMDSTSVAMNTDVMFDAGKSHAADGSALTYTWNFNDGTSEQGQRVTHKFAVLGNGLVALIVTDAHGATSVATKNVIIVPELPVAAIRASSLNVSPGGTVTFDATGSTPPSNPPGDTIAHFTWDFGDGSAQETTQSPQASHQYQTAGTFKVTVGAVEQAGAAGLATVSIHVGNAAPGGSATGDAAPWLWGAGIAALVMLGYLGYRSWSRGQAERERERQQQMAREFARARRVNGRGDTR